MPVLEIQAQAKLNLSLDVLRRREDGYHEMRMVMQTVDLCDQIRLETGTGEPLRMSSSLGFLPANEKNLAAAAALRLCEAVGADHGGLSIRLEKRIPVCAGLAGGSADAAAVLRGLNALLSLGLSREELAEVGARVGSDVPYCVRGGTALAEGRGERLTPLPPLPSCYGRIAALKAGDLPGVARRMYNVFEDALPPRRRVEVRAIQNTLIQHGALGASMSGTGPTVFGLFDRAEAAQSARDALAESYSETFLTRIAGPV